MGIARIIFITTNTRKVVEIQASLAKYGASSLPKIGAVPEGAVPDVVEAQGTPQAVVRHKCIGALTAIHQQYAVPDSPAENSRPSLCSLLDAVFPDDAPHSSATDTYIMVEDTSLEFDNLNGLPGAYIKDFFSTLGLRKLSALARAPLDDKVDVSAPAGAHARTLLALVPLLPPCTAAASGDQASPQPVVLEGVTDGHIVPLPDDFDGPSFGFDPIFYVPSVGATYHDMGMETKNSVSHRGKAVAALANFLSERTD